MGRWERMKREEGRGKIEGRRGKTEEDERNWVVGR